VSAFSGSGSGGGTDSTRTFPLADAGRRYQHWLEKLESAGLYPAETLVAVIDSFMHREPVSAFIHASDKDVSQHAEGAYDIELHPTYRAMIDLMHAVGFRNIVEAVAVEAPDKCPHKLYDTRVRRCLVGIK